MHQRVTETVKIVCHKHLALLSLAVALLALPSSNFAQTKPARQTVSTSDDLYNQGVDAYSRNDYAGAIAKFEAAIAKRPTFTDAYFNLGICYSAANKPQDAIKEFTWVINKMPPAPKSKCADAFHERGRCYVALKDAKSALADFEQALALKPNDSDIFLDRAAAYYTDQQYDKAIADYTQYLTANSKVDPLVYNNRGLAYMARFVQTKAETNAKAAIPDFEKYTTADPKKNIDGYLGLGDAYAALKMYAKAVTAYTSYLAENPTDVYALGARARANMEIKNFRAAVEDYTKIVNINPTDVNAKINLSIAQLMAGNSKGAILILNDSIGNPPNKTALAARAQAFVNAQDWANAVKDYDALLKIDPNDAISLFNRGVVNSQLGADDKAVTDYLAYLQTDPKDPAPAYAGLGTAYMKLKKYPEAREAFAKYIYFEMPPPRYGYDLLIGD